MSNPIFDRMLDKDVVNAAARNMYDNRMIELDQSGGDDWDILPEAWRDEWAEGARHALEAAVAILAFENRSSDDVGSGS